MAAPLERLLYQIDGVEYVYSMAHENQAVITVRFYVGEDRERSLVKIFKKIDENVDLVPAGVSGWVVKPVEIDDVPIVTLTLTEKRQNAETPKNRNGQGGDDAGAVDEFALRRVAEELVERLAAVTDVSRAYVVGGQPRVVYVRLNPDRLQAYHVSPVEIQRAVGAANVNRTAGEFTRQDQVYRVEAGRAFARPEELKELVVAVFENRPVFLKDVATIVDGPEEAVSYVRHGWGPARGFEDQPDAAGSLIDHASPPATDKSTDSSSSVTIAISKKKGANAVSVANQAVAAARSLTSDIVPDDMELVITRNAGLTSNEKVNELVEALAVAIFIVIALLTIGLGWRESLIVAVAVPVVFGPDADGQPALRLHDQPRNALRADPLPRPAGRRPHRRRGEHRPALCDSRPSHTRNRAGGCSRDSAAADHRHAGRDRLFPADVLHHRHDGAVHAADGPERAGRDADVDGGGVHDHAVAGVPLAAQAL